MTYTIVLGGVDRHDPGLREDTEVLPQHRGGFFLGEVQVQD